jgi:4-carboxymuconolactone decarboxylase
MATPSRFPIEEAPDASAKDIMEAALSKMHGGSVPFKWVKDDGSSLLGMYAPLR